MTKKSEQLDEALERGTLIRFRSAYDGERFEGYVLDVGARYFLLRCVSDDILFNGFSCFRIADVRRLAPAPHADFIVAALRLRCPEPPQRPAIDLASIESIIASGAPLFPLTTIHCERDYPDECYIGAVAGIRRGQLSLLEVNPSALWDTEPTNYQLSRITRVEFGGLYEDALHLVAGAPPT